MLIKDKLAYIFSKVDFGKSFLDAKAIEGLNTYEKDLRDMEVILQKTKEFCSYYSRGYEIRPPINEREEFELSVAKELIKDIDVLYSKEKTPKET